MKEPSQTHQNQLKRLKESVRNSYEYMKDNYDRFHEDRKFTFKTSMSDAELSLCYRLNKPTVENNFLESMISRQRGEFYKQQPTISVTSRDNAPTDPRMIQIIEGHTRSILFDANNNSFEYNVYTDMLSGGFSVMEVYTDYIHPMSFDQAIYLRRPFDPTLCGFDPLAQYPHKGDGRYCFKLYPKSAEEAKTEFPMIDLDEIKFVRDMDGFNWSYGNDKEDILLVCDFYEKKKKLTEIVRLSDGRVLTTKAYEKELDDWKNRGIMMQPPIVVGKPRDTELETICRYRLVENKVIEYVETDFSYLPLVFADGNSVTLRDTATSAAKQFTRSYIYQAKGIQKLRNFTLQTAANRIENMTMQQWKAAKEGIPKGYEDAYTNPQTAAMILYNAYKPDDPEKPLPPPQEVQSLPMPPEVMGLLAATDQMLQSTLGNYDSALGINDNQLSGVAIVESATQSNAAAMPYVVGFMQALTQASQIIIDLIPKYYVTPRTIPVNGVDGERKYIQINKNVGQPNGKPDFNYDPHVLEVKVEAGVNFAIQKSRALQQIISLSQASPIFAQFINTKGLKVLLDNIEIRGIDQLKSLSDEFAQQVEQQQKQAQQNNPEMIKLQQNAQELKLRETKLQQDQVLQASKVGIAQQDSDNDRLRLMLEMKQNNAENFIELEKQQTERARAATDLELEHAKHHHSATMDALELHHKVNIDHMTLQHQKDTAQMKNDVSESP